LWNYILFYLKCAITINHNNNQRQGLCNDNKRSDQISQAEWQARCELIALYRVIAYYKMTASSLVKIDYNGEIVAAYALDKSVNQAVFVIHLANHHACPEIDCVMHTHTADGIAVSAQKQGLLPISQYALKFCWKLA
jgi:hypothetical protein